MALRNRDRLLRKLAALPETMRRAIGPAMAQGADEIVALQKRLVPKRSGALARSIKAVKGSYAPDNANVRGVGVGSEGIKGDPELSLHIVAGDAEAFYAAMVEHGTQPHRNGGRFEGSIHPGATATPFFYPAYRALRRRTKARISRAGRMAAKTIAAGARADARTDG